MVCIWILIKGWVKLSCNCISHVAAGGGEMCEEVGDARWNVEFGMCDLVWGHPWLRKACSSDTVDFGGLTCSGHHRRALTDGENRENGEGRVTLHCLRDSTILYVWRVILSQAGDSIAEHFENFSPVFHFVDSFFKCVLSSLFKGRMCLLLSCYACAGNRA